MNVAYVNPFLSATINLLAQTFGMEAVPGQPYLDERAARHRWDISAVMVLTGNAIGVVAIRLTRILAERLLVKSGVTWDNPEEKDDLMNAMVGELVNIIAGNASSELGEYNIDISVPIVIQGEHHTVSWPDKAPIIGIPFSTPAGPLLVNISLIELPKAYQKSSC